MLENLEQQQVPWAIVTSGTRPLVSRQLHDSLVKHRVAAYTSIR